MLSKFKSFVATFITVFTLSAFAVPMICAPAHAHEQSTTKTSAQNEIPDCDMSIVVKKVDTTKDQGSHKPGKATDNCCVGHHCCAAKLIAPLNVTVAFIESTTVQLTAFVNQIVTGFDIHGLDRPPKNLA